MREITVFKHEMFGEVRTMVNENGETFFVGKDVAKALGYTNPPKALRDHVDEEDKLGERIVLSGQYREAIFINESGLYSLVLSSKLPQAKDPTKDSSGRQLSDMEIMALALQIQQNTIEAQHRQIEDMAPKAEYCDEVLESVSCFTTTQVAKELNMTVHELTHLLIERNVMYKQSGQYMLYKDYAHNTATTMVRAACIPACIWCGRRKAASSSTG